MEHGQALVGHHGLGVTRCFLGERGLSADRPGGSIGEASLRKQIDRTGAVNTARSRAGDPGRNREQEQHQHQGEGLVGGSHEQMEGLALLEAKGSVHHRGGDPLAWMAHV